MTRRIFCKALLIVIAIFGVLALSSVLSAQGNSENAFERVREVQEIHTNRLMAMDGVEGTAIGYNQNDRLAVKVFTAGPDIHGIPRILDGVPVQVEVTGKFYALPKPPWAGPPDGEKEEKVDPTGWFPRPVPIGVSTGNEGECSSGTIGCRVTGGGNVYALSNNHVYALENNAYDDSKVLQPGLYDTNCEYDENNVIGKLANYVEIEFSETASNVVDAAIALTETDMVGNATPSDGYGTPKSSIVSAELYQPVQKYGRTTSLTKGTVTGINAIVNVGYSSGTARFVKQIIVQSRKPFIKAGDSGSLLVTDPDKEPVGLLFAGNGNGKLAVANPIDAVLDAFHSISIDGE